MRTNGIIVALMLSLISLAAVPTATAHTCAAYSGCDAETCVDGENHSHTDYNYWPFEDESCTSSADPKDPSGCEFLGLDWPELVCDLVHEPQSLLVNLL